MKCLVFFLALLFAASTLSSQTRLKLDTGYVTARSFNKGELNELKTQKEFQYNRPAETARSLWDKFWDWFWWKIHQVLNTKGGRTTFWSTLIILAVAALVFFILNITGMNKNGLFGRGNKGLQKYTLSQNDINNISFDDAIEKAVSSGNYRLATRLQYLQALKKLSDKGYIYWQINKTNTDYLSEIAGKPFVDMFTRLTHNFEYTWYGEKPVSKESYITIKNQFQHFNNQV